MGRDIRLLTALAATLIVAPTLSASGFQLREQNPAAQGNSFAGVTAGYGGLGSEFFNPAALSLVDGRQMLIGLSSVMPSAELYGAVGTRSAALPAPVRPISGPSAYGDAAHNAILPNLAAVWSMTDDLKIGLAVAAPYGLVTEYPTDFVGRYHGLKSDLKTVDVAVSAAYRFSPRFAAGATVLYRKAEATLTTGVDFGLVASSLGTTPGTLDGVASLKGSKGAIGMKLGAIFTPTPQLRIGLAHQAAMNMELSGDATYQFPSTMPAPLVAGLQARGFKDGEGRAELRLPSVSSIGVDWDLNGAFSIQAEAAQTGWSTFKELRVKFSTGLPDSVTDEYWKDAWYYSLGASWKVSDSLVLRAGVARDQSAVDEVHRTPRIPDSDRSWVSVGASWSVGQRLTLDFGYSHIAVQNGSLALAAGVDPAGQNFSRGNLTGTYTSGIEVIALAARFRF